MSLKSVQEYLQTLKDLKDEESCMGLIMIDNYDEMIDLLPDDKKALILALLNLRACEYIFL